MSYSQQDFAVSDLGGNNTNAVHIYILETRNTGNLYGYFLSGFLSSKSSKIAKI